MKKIWIVRNSSRVGASEQLSISPGTLMVMKSTSEGLVILTTPVVVPFLGISRFTAQKWPPEISGGFSYALLQFDQFPGGCNVVEDISVLDINNNKGVPAHMPALSGFSKGRVLNRPYEHPKGGHKEIPRSSDSLKARLKEEDVLSRIERGSRCPARGQRKRPVIDLYILRRFMNKGEIQSEEPCAQKFKGKFKTAADVGEGELTTSDCSLILADFRNQLDADACTCIEGETCVLCCTEFDLAAIPQSPVIERQHLSKKPNDVNLFYVTMPIDLALRLGFITEEALRSK